MWWQISKKKLKLESRVVVDVCVVYKRPTKTSSTSSRVSHMPRTSKDILEFLLELSLIELSLMGLVDSRVIFLKSFLWNRLRSCVVR